MEDNNQKFERIDLGKGTLFMNQNKQPGSQQPDFTGKVELPDGTEARISGWNRVGKQSGTPYIGFKLWNRADQPMQGQQPAGESGSIFPSNPTPEPSAAFGNQVQQQPNPQQRMSQGQDEIPF